MQDLYTFHAYYIVLEKIWASKRTVGCKDAVCISLRQNRSYLRLRRLRNAPHYLALFITVPSIHSSLRLNEFYEVDMSAQIAWVFQFWTLFFLHLFFLLQGKFRVAVFYNPVFWDHSVQKLWSENAKVRHARWSSKRKQEKDELSKRKSPGLYGVHILRTFGAFF